MRWQTTAVLAIVFVALATFYYVYEIRLGPEREKRAGQQGRLFAVDAADVTAVEVRRGAEVVKLAREGEGWQMLEPVKARGDRGKVEELVTSVAMARMDREIAAAPAALGEFGLDRPAAEVTLTLKGGRQLGLHLGAKSPTGVWVYARDRDRPAVVAVGDTVLREATLPLADLRDKTVLAFDRREVTAFDIVTGDDTLAVEPAAPGQWKLTRPVALAADADTVADLLDKLATVRVKEFVAEAPRSLEPYGLERPLRLAIHTGRDKERATKALLIGRVDAAKKGVYAMRPGESSVLLLPEEIWTALPRNVAAIRNKLLVEFDRDKVTEVEIASPRGTVALARQGGRWRITAPEPLPADQVEAGAVLARVRELKAWGFLTDDASGVPRYLARPQVRVAITEEGAPGPLTVLLAPSPDQRGGQPAAYAAVAGRGPVVLVDGKALGELARSVADLRDRTLLAGLDAKEIHRLRLRAGGQAMLLERSGEAAWRVLEPARGSARSTRVDDLLYTLRALRWREIAAPTGDEPARYGLDAPALEVGLYRADGTEIATVLIGKREKDRAWVRTRAAPAIYAVEAAQLGELPKLPDDLTG